MQTLPVIWRGSAINGYYFSCIGRAKVAYLIWKKGTYYTDPFLNAW